MTRALLETLELSEAETTAAECRKPAQDIPLERCAGAYEALYGELLAGRRRP